MKRTTVHEWFVFDALEFDHLFYRNGQLKKDFIEWSQGKKSGNSTDFFYKEIAAPFISGLSDNFTYTYFNLKDYEKPLRNTDQKDSVKLVQLYKLLSPAHLLKESFANDANSLDQGFYKELVHTGPGRSIGGRPQTDSPHGKTGARLASGSGLPETEVRRLCIGAGECI